MPNWSTRDHNEGSQIVSFYKKSGETLFFDS